MNLTDLLTKIGSENLKFQLLNQCLLSVQATKTKGNRITFATEAITPDEILSNDGAIGVIVWVPRDKWIAATKDMS